MTSSKEIDFITEFGEDSNDFLATPDDGVVFDSGISKKSAKLSYYQRNRNELAKQNTERKMRRYNTDPEYRKKCIEYARNYRIKKVDPLRYELKKQIADAYDDFAKLKEQYDEQVRNTLEKIQTLKAKLRRIPACVLQDVDIDKVDEVVETE